MTVNQIDKSDCTGCWACYNQCPAECITMKEDAEGFKYPSVDAAVCVQCGGCVKSCPSINPVDVSQHRSEPRVYAAWSLDEEIRQNSTSGGAFSEIAKLLLEGGGYVCGAEYDSNHQVRHCVINHVDQLNRLRQSKYVQSDTGMVFREIREHLDASKDVLFCGTPCQCAGLRKYLNRDYSNLYSVDFICRGSNSPLVYRKFLHYLENAYHSKVTRVWFKNKAFGWNRFSTRIDFEDGGVYLRDRHSDTYIRGYIEANLYMRDSCGACKYKSLPRVSDITLGDFWGVKLSDDSLDTDKGTSVVMLNSPKGERLFDGAKRNLFFEEKTVEDVYKKNKCLFESPKLNRHKKTFFEDMDRLDLIENISQYCRGGSEYGK
ncbi:Coenzyme F420 hydrogenase/dehydrogenase, beta subunit C-terminal domain [Oscillospiraceae bacterium OttesenSCG-928-F05]|nr:Coenzyme F420 hydrogenase/dehydrogenase, beta subunit C-terminal domain [Oscillospiraceae bacterium OttesenSCG-928-F05]